MSQIPYKGLIQDLYRTPAPIIISVLMILYLGMLSYYSHNIKDNDPEFNFYSTSIVKAEPLNLKQELLVNAIYNNVVEGQRQSVGATYSDSGFYRFDFNVNSPRPATVYIEGESVEIFLIPDSTLKIRFLLNPVTQIIDSINFEGPAANICRYYQLVGKHSLSVLNTLSSEDLSSFGKQADSIMAVDLNFLNEMKSKLSLPEWFVLFQTNELVYQKAYIKLSAAGKKKLPEGYEDSVLIDNKDAVFSYHYYLYLNQYFKKLISQKKSVSEESVSKSQIQLMAISDSLLKSEAHDVFVSRLIINSIQKNQLETAELLFQAHANIKQKKYYRFLQRVLESQKKV